MSLQKVNSDVAVNLLVTGVIRDEQYIEAAVQSGVEREQAVKDLAALYSQREEAEVKARLSQFKKNTLAQFIQLGQTIAIPYPEIWAVRVALEISGSGKDGEPTRSVAVDKFQIKKTGGERFISLTQAGSSGGASKGGNGKVPIPTAIKETGLDSWVKIAGALSLETDSTQNARLVVKRQGGEKGLALYELTNDAIKGLPMDATLETRQEAVDQAYEGSMLEFP